MHQDPNSPDWYWIVYDTVMQSWRLAFVRQPRTMMQLHRMVRSPRSWKESDADETHYILHRSELADFGIIL